MKRNILIFAPIAILFFVIVIYFGMQRQAPALPGNATVANLFASIDARCEWQNEFARGMARQTTDYKFLGNLVCGPCAEEMSELNAVQTKIAAKKIRVIGVGIESQDNITRFAQKYQISYPLYVTTALLRQFGNQAGGACRSLS